MNKFLKIIIPGLVVLTLAGCDTIPVNEPVYYGDDGDSYQAVQVYDYGHYHHRDGNYHIPVNSGGNGNYHVPVNSGGNGNYHVPVNSGGNGNYQVPVNSGGNGNYHVPVNSGGNGNYHAPVNGGGNENLLTPVKTMDEIKPSVKIN